MKPWSIVHALVGYLGVMLVVGACDFPYSPEQEPEPGGSDQSTADLGGTPYKVNADQQVCNPSISQNETTYNACMLWLGFSSLGVNVPEEITGYSLEGVTQHDRMTISDTADNVRWYMMNYELGLDTANDADPQVQDPEWSTHPDYLACLGQGGGSASDPWLGYVVRINAAKDYLQFCNNDARMPSDATPHLWVSQAATGGTAAASPEYEANGFVKKEHIATFFGTSDVKITFSKSVGGTQTIHYVDYSEASPAPKQLAKPDGKSDWNCESALISPDGHYVLYQAWQTRRYGEGYLQRLDQASTADLVAVNCWDPHFWVDPDDDRCFVIYASMQSARFILDDIFGLSDADVLQGTKGLTCKLELNGRLGDLVGHRGLSVNAAIEPQRIAGFPFKGGMDRSGRYLGTAYDKAYIMSLD